MKCVFVPLTSLLLFLAISAHSDVFTVTSLEDNLLIPGTLRWAVSQANGVPGPDVINFSVGNSLVVFSDLNISDRVFISGAKTQVIGGGRFILIPDSDGSTISGVIFNYSGVEVQSNCNRIIGSTFMENGISISGSYNDIGGNIASERNMMGTGLDITGNAHRNTIRGNYIGLLSDGATGLGTGVGINIEGNTFQNMVGGNKNNGEGNVIRGFPAVDVRGSSYGNSVCGNIIGLSADQSTRLNISIGIRIYESSKGHCIGLSQDGYGNIIAGYLNYGVEISGFGRSTIKNNLIGLSESNGTFGGMRGLYIHDTIACVVGGVRSAGQYNKNIISNNSYAGIEVYQSSNNTICGNYIGLTVDGSASAGNQRGIYINNGYDNLIGGFEISGGSLYGNIISGNQSGIGLYYGGGNTIAGNYIGLNAAGNAAVPNTSYGINDDRSVNTLIGGPSSELRNVISGNPYGIYLSQNAHNTQIWGNYIGTNASGTGQVSNTTYAIFVQNTNNTEIGGTSIEKRNVICGTGTAIRVAGSMNTTIYNNLLGLLPNYNYPSQNLTSGIVIDSNSQTGFIGRRSISNSGNLIRGTGTGISISGVNSDYNEFVGNTICNFSTAGISLAGDGANQNKASPAILSPADVALIQGTTSGSNDFIEVFISDRGAGQYGGSLRSVGTTTAVSGNWSLVPTGLSGGEYVCAIATDSSGNSSGFSLNQLVQVPTPTVTPTQTPTPTATPATQVLVHSLAPEYYYSNRAGTFTLRGKALQNPLTIKLVKSGVTDRAATSINIVSQELATCSFDLTGLPAGNYNVQAQIPGSQSELQNALTIISEIVPPINWTVADLGQAGITAQTSIRRGLTLGDGNNDRQRELYSAGLLQNLLQYKCTGASDWGITQLPTGPIGEYYTDVIVFDKDNDGQNEVYGSTLDHHVYGFSGTNWVNREDSGDLGYAVNALAYGDGNNDDILELYIATENGDVIESQYNGTGWSSNIIGNATGKMMDLAVGDGNQDGENEVYVACEDKNLYQLKFNGSTWAKTIVATGGDDMLSVAIGDGNQDGSNEVYCTNLDGKIYQCKWTSTFFWNITQVADQTSRDLLVGDADNDGTQEVYIAAINGHVCQCKYANSQWSNQDLGSAPAELYALVSGDGDNDYQLELYALAGDSHVYQIKASHSQPTPTPTKTPVPDFDGQIISKNYVYAAPNPIRGHIAKIHIMTLQPAEVSVKMYTITNKEVMSFNRNYSTGMQIESVNMSNLANGVYFLLVKARAANGAEEKVLKKIALIK
ncbi:MAG: hypothetical protein AB1439_05400 [candidate division FCPU426 bacterium]